MAYWAKRPASPDNLRLYDPEVGWRKPTNTTDTDGRVLFQGSGGDIERVLLSALNANNLLVLAGAGASYCATNPPGSPNAPSVADLWDAVEAKVTSSVIADVIALIPTAAGIGKNIEKLLTLSKLYASLFDDATSTRVKAFLVSAETAILDRADFVQGLTDLSSHRSFIRKVARRGLRKPRVKVFTTNYDLVFESAAQASQFVLIDGFSHTTPAVFDRAHFSYDTVRRTGAGQVPDYIENALQLFKLHGSVDWKRSPHGTILRSRSSADGTPVLIYPRDTKYQEAFEPPYLDIMGSFQTALREPDTAIIVSGFGFRDDHLSRPILAALEANMSLRLIVCDVCFIPEDALLTEGDSLPKSSSHTGTNSYLDHLVALVDQRDTRITVLNGRFEDLTMAIPDIVAQTDRERHLERLRNARDSLNESPTDAR